MLMKNSGRAWHLSLRSLKISKKRLQTAAQPPPLPAPATIIADPNYGFLEEELEKIKEHGLPSSSEAFHSGEESSARKRAANINKNLGGQKDQSKKGSPKREKLDANINNLRKYQDRLKIIESNREKFVQQRGKGLVFYNKPEDLLDRLELLGGSIEAGNSSKAVARQFSAIAHKLRDPRRTVKLGADDDFSKLYYIVTTWSEPSLYLQ